MSLFRRSTACLLAGLFLVALGCEEEKPAEPSKPSAQAKKAAASASTPAPAPSPTPSKPPVACPEGSTGEGTYDKPCVGSGPSRMMEVTWTGKMDEKGPSFRVVNVSPATILFGKIAVYFYDKAGKQLEVKGTGESADKTKPFHSCSGNMFAGVMKAEEKAVITFSCVKQKHVPEGTKDIEAEMQMVGFADADEKQSEYYWQNKDLVPDQRKKGGLKAPKKKKK